MVVLWVFYVALAKSTFIYSAAGFGFYDTVLAFDKWADGYHGYTIDQLNYFNGVAQTIYYTTMLVMQYGSILSIRTRRNSILEANPLWGPRSNRRIFLAMACSASIGVLIQYAQVFQNVFNTQIIPTKYWFIPFGFAAGILLIDETRKLIVRTYPKVGFAI